MLVLDCSVLCQVLQTQEGKKYAHFIYLCLRVFIYLIVSNLYCTVNFDFLSFFPGFAGRDLMSLFRAVPIPTLSLTVDKHSFLVSCNNKLGPNPAQPIVASKRLHVDLIARIKLALLNMPKFVTIATQTLGFVDVDEDHYKVTITKYYMFSS